MKKLVLVAAHFTPSNLASVHRARLWSQHLREFGWDPTIVTTHHRYYEETLDWELHALVPEDLRVVRTRALPVKPVRVVGDIGIRALPFHYRALAKLAKAGDMDFLHITIPSHYSALLGRLVHLRHGTPYGLDYIDPWVHEWPGTDVRFSRAWTSARLARLLEPWAVRDASLITGVAELYYEGMLERNPDVRRKAVSAAMPYGGSEHDFAEVRERARPTWLFDPSDGRFHVVYAGALLPKAFAVLERFLEGVALLRDHDPQIGERLRVHFVGSGKSPDDPTGFNVLPHVRRLGLEGLVDEHPARVPYTDVLNHLVRASGVLVLGSTERHYTPSKAFQGLLSGRPVLAILHEESTAVELLRRIDQASVISFAEGGLPDAEEIARRLGTLVRSGASAPAGLADGLLDDLSAKASAQLLAEALDRALAGQRR
jgi:hypothetical protein